MQENQYLYFTKLNWVRNIILNYVGDLILRFLINNSLNASLNLNQNPENKTPEENHEKTYFHFQNQSLTETLTPTKPQS